MNQDGKESNVHFDRPIVKCRIAIPKENVSMVHVTVNQDLKGSTVKSKIVSIQLVPIVAFVSKENVFVNLVSVVPIAQVLMIDSLNSFQTVPIMAFMMLTLLNVPVSTAIRVIIVQ